MASFLAAIGQLFVALCLLAFEFVGAFLECVLEFRDPCDGPDYRVVFVPEQLPAVIGDNAARRGKGLDRLGLRIEDVLIDSDTVAPDDNFNREYKSPCSCRWRL